MRQSALSGVSAQGIAALVAGVVLCLVNGLLYAWSLFVLPLEALRGWTRAESSLTFTFVLVFFSLGMAAGGFILTRIGPRRSVLLGGGLFAAGLWLASIAESLWLMYLAYGVMAGFGIGVANVAPSAVLMRWFPTRRGLVSGILAMSLAAGTFILGTLLAGQLIGRIGVQGTFTVLAGVVLVVMLPAAWFLQMPPQQSNAGPNAVPQEGMSPREMLVSRPFLLVSLWAAAVQTGGLMIAGHIAPYAMESGSTASLAAMAVGIYALSNALGRLFFGYLLDAWGARWSMGLNALTMTLGMGLLVLLPPHIGFTGIVLSVMLIAGAYGGTVPQIYAFIARYFGSRHLSANLGFGASTVIIAGIAGPYLGSAMRQIFGNYSGAMLSAAAIALLGVLAVVLLFFTGRAPQDPVKQ